MINKRISGMFFILSLILLNISFFLISCYDNEKNPLSPIEIHPNISSIIEWNLTGSLLFGSEGVVASILIDDLNSNYTWEKIAAENEWCSGNGTLDNPYIIENVYIDGELIASNLGIYIGYSCIYIRNTVKYFIIRNCILERTGVGEKSAGITLHNASNALIVNNECNFNMIGISVIYSESNIEVRSNSIKSDYNSSIDYEGSLYGMGQGIYLLGSNGIIIKENNITDLSESIVVWDGNRHDIQKNVLLNTKNSNFCSAIVFHNCNYTDVIDNYIIGFKNEYTILESECLGNTFNNEIIGGFINLRTSAGLGESQIFLEYSNYNTFVNNKFFSNYQDYLNYLEGSNFLIWIIIGTSLISIGVLVFIIMRLRKKKHSN